LISLRFGAFAGKPFLAPHLFFWILLDSMTLEMNQMNTLWEHSGTFGSNVDPKVSISDIGTQIERRIVIT
jgi:hypothetical protein